MKIVYLHQYFNTPTMSGGTRSYEMARRLVASGHEVHMVTSVKEQVPGDAAWRLTNESGIHVHWYPVPYSNNMSFYRRIKAFFIFAFVSAVKASSIEADVVFATSTPLTIAIPAVYVSRKNKIPMVFEVRDLWPELPIAVKALTNPVAICGARWLERFAYTNSKRIIALSPGMKDGIVNVGYPAHQVTVIPNGSDLELFNIKDDLISNFRSKYEWLGDRPLVVYCGTLGLINGVHYLAELAEKVMRINPEVRFLIVGEGRETEFVRKKAQELGVFNKNFFMLPQMVKKDVPVVLRAANLSTSVVIDVKEIWNNSANKFFDSLAAGTPIVINHGGWQADILKKTGAGIIIDSKNVESAARTIITALLDKEWLVQARSAALKLAREEFSRDLLASRLEHVLCEAVEAHRRR